MLTYFLLLIPLQATGQITTSCCNKREIGGSDQNSGVYWLEASGDGRCSDGCVYSKESVDGNFYCFSSSNRYVIDCSEETKPVNVTQYWLNRAIIEPDTLTEPGDEGVVEYCPLDTYAVAFELEYAPLCRRRCAKDDDVALMAIRLHCATLDDTTTEIASITSDVLEGYTRAFGGLSLGTKWTTKQNCPVDKFIDSSQFLSEYFRIATGETFSNVTCPAGIVCSEITLASFDPIGGMNLNVRCNDETQLDGGAVAQSERSESSAWSDWQDCPTNYVVCGIQTRVSSGDGSDTTQNLGNTGVKMICCELPPGYY